MYKKEVPKFNRENFPTWKILMKMNIQGIGDTTCTSVEIGFTTTIGTLIAQEPKEKKEHNQAMLEIASSLSYSKYDDIKKYYTTKEMWDTLAHIYGGDTNVLRAKLKSLKGKFDDMRM